MKVMALATRHTSASPCSLKAAYCSISAGGTALYTHHSRLTIRLRQQEEGQEFSPFSGILEDADDTRQMLAAWKPHTLGRQKAQEAG